MKKFDKHVLPPGANIASTKLLEQKTVMVRNKLMSSFGAASAEQDSSRSPSVELWKASEESKANTEYTEEREETSPYKWDGSIQGCPKTAAKSEESSLAQEDESPYKSEFQSPVIEYSPRPQETSQAIQEEDKEESEDESKSSTVEFLSYPANNFLETAQENFFEVNEAAEKNESECFQNFLNFIKGSKKGKSNHLAYQYN